MWGAHKKNNTTVTAISLSKGEEDWGDFGTIVMLEDLTRSTDTTQDKWSQCPNKLTSFERFISLRTLMTIVSSLSVGLALFAAPRVLSTDRMLRNPKS